MDNNHFKQLDQLTTAELLEQLGSSETGLTAAQAEQRLAEVGLNRLREEHRRTPWQMLTEQYRNPMIVLLLGAVLVSAAIGEVADALVILAIVVANSLIGFWQDFRAEKSLAALKKMAAQDALVWRDGQLQKVAAEMLVPGDRVALEAGVIVPADLRLTVVHGLQVDESPLTGESLPVEKSARPAQQRRSEIGARNNMLFRGTRVSYGRGSGFVSATGMNTEMGKIAYLLDTTEKVKTPLQQRLAKVGRNLALLAVLICSAVFVAGTWRGEDPFLMFLTAVSLAVAAVPEALPAVVTISLALGARQLVRKNSLIRRLSAVETLGSVTCICSDKTGTLTRNQMLLEKLIDAQLQEVTAPLAADDPLLLALALSNDVAVGSAGALLGDPTETALYAKAATLVDDLPQLKKRWPRIGEIPFSSERQTMSTLHQAADGTLLLLSKGSFEAIAARCQGGLAEGVERQVEQLADGGLRVLAFAWRRFENRPEKIDAQLETELCFAGLSGSFDPPRAESAAAVQRCRTAGISALMITGDHPLTARRIAQRIGLIDGADQRVVSGAELATLGPDQLTELVGQVRVFARVAPEQKLRIVAALQQRGEVVAMTGDGVNDAPALKRAEIGIAMGISGTDVAKEAAEMVLLDDNFATIVRAVREGRVIYDNIRVFFRYILTSNVGELATIFFAPFLGLPLPLLPIHILWINLITDSAPALALATEPGAADVMRRPPLAPDEGLFGRGLGWRIAVYGLLLGAVTLATQAVALQQGWHWQTMVFTVLCLSQLFYAFAARSENSSFFRLGAGSNRFLSLTVIVGVAVQLLIIYVPPLQPVFRTQSLTLPELSFSLLMAGLLFALAEAEKWFKNKLFH